MPRPTDPSLMRSLGLVAGDLWSAVTGKPRKPDKKTVRHEVQEQARDTPDGKLILRRTTIEEVELQRPDARPPTP